MKEKTEIEERDLSGYTPIMQQYIRHKERFPSTLVLFRLGDFYETFFDDALSIHRLIGITLTKRGKDPQGNPIPMAGVPAVSLEQYVARLVRLGQSVVIVEQFGTPGKPDFERRVSRIITPGTLTEDNLLPEKSNAVLLAVSAPSRKGRPYGFAWMTLSNGEFYAEEVPLAQIETEIARISPSEVLVDEELKKQLSQAFPSLAFTTMPEWHFDSDRGAQQLKELFSLDNLDAWGASDKVEILACANALLDYAGETQVDMMPYLLPMKVVSDSDYIIIDAASRRNLEICDSIRKESSRLTLLGVMDDCETPMGSRCLRRLLNEPLRDRDEVVLRQNAVQKLIEWERKDALLEAVHSLPDIERIASRIALRRARPRDLSSLRDALPVLSAISSGLLRAEDPLLTRISAQAVVPSEVEELLRAAIMDEPSAFIRDGDVIRSEFNEELKSLRDLRDNTSRFLLEFEQNEKAATGISTLRVEFNKVHGFYIEMPKGAAASAPGHYIRKQTLKNVERFTTHELKSYEEKALSSRERTLDLESELYDGVVAALSEHVESLLRAASAAAFVDALGAVAKHSIKMNWVKPVISEKSGITIVKGRHPVVETTIERYIPNDARLGDGRRLLIITGPNMGGKSTYMRSVALICLLAWAGFFVPAQSAEIGPIDRIHTRIGASDDLARGRSTFMVEMTEAAQILHEATSKSLVLMDEIGRGTSTYDGLALAGAIAQELVAGIRSYTLFATHYFELTQMANTEKEAANVHVSASQTKSRVVFMHEVEEGPAQKSYGVAVAQLAGVPAHVVRRAKALLSELEREKVRDEFNLFAEISSPAEEEPREEMTRDEKEALKIVRALQSIDADSLSPREALALVFDLKNAAEELNI